MSAIANPFGSTMMMIARMGQKTTTKRLKRDPKKNRGGSSESGSARKPYKRWTRNKPKRNIQNENGFRKTFVPKEPIKIARSFSPSKESQTSKKPSPA